MRDFQLEYQLFTLFVPNASPTTLDSEEPLKRSRGLQLKGYLHLHPSHTTTVDFMCEIVRVQDDFGFPFGVKEKTRYLDIVNTVKNLEPLRKNIPPQCDNETRESVNCQPYGTASLFPTNLKRQAIQQRHIKSVRDVLSSIGGFYAAAMLIASFSFNIFFKRISNLAKRRLFEATFSLKPSSARCWTKNLKLPQQSPDWRPGDERAAYKAGLQIIEESLDVSILVCKLCLLKTLLLFAIDEQTQLSIPNHMLLSRVAEREDRIEIPSPEDSLASSLIKLDDNSVVGQPDQNLKTSRLPQSNLDPSNQGDPERADDTNTKYHGSIRNLEEQLCSMSIRSSLQCSIAEFQKSFVARSRHPD